MRNKTSLALALCLLTWMLALPTLAREGASERILRSAFSELEKQAIGDYYSGRYGKKQQPRKHKAKKHKKNKPSKGLPPGLARRDRLPPGLEKQLQRDGTLPPGLAKRGLPDNLQALLPRPLPGQERVLVDNDVVLIERATGLILDILRDVF